MSASSPWSASQLIAGSTPAFAVLSSAFCAFTSVNPISSSASTLSFVTTGGPAAAAAASLFLLKRASFPAIPLSRAITSSSVSIATPALSSAFAFAAGARSPIVFSSNVSASGTRRRCRSTCVWLKHTLPVSLHTHTFSVLDT